MALHARRDLLHRGYLITAGDLIPEGEVDAAALILRGEACDPELCVEPEGCCGAFLKPAEPARPSSSRKRKG